MTIKKKFLKIEKKIKMRNIGEELALVRRNCLFWYASIVLELYIFFIICNKVRDFPSY